MNNLVNTAVNTVAAIGVAEAVSFVAKKGLIAGKTATWAPTLSLGAAAGAAVLTDKVAERVIPSVTGFIGKHVAPVNELLNHKWTQVALRIAADAAAASAVALFGFGVALQVSALAPFAIAGAVAPTAIAKVRETVGV